MLSGRRPKSSLIGRSSYLFSDIGYYQLSVQRLFYVWPCQELKDVAALCEGVLAEAILICD